MAIEEQVLCSVQDAVASISSGIDRLLEMADATDFAALGAENLIEAMRAFETQRNRLSSVDHGFIEAAEIESLWERTTARGTAGALAQILHLSKAEASVRVRAAKWFGPRITLDGQELPPSLPIAAAAQRDGTASTAQAAVIGHCMDELASDPELDVNEVRAAEQYLVDKTSAFGPHEMQRIAAKLVDTLIPDGTPPRDPLVNARRGLKVGPQRRDGTASISGSLTPDVRAQLWAVLSSLSAPRPTGPKEPDTRSTAQRNHDALGEACAKLLASTELPSSGGVPATVIVTTTFEQMQAAAERMNDDDVQWDQRASSFTTVDGMRLSLAQFLRVAGEAEVVPAFLDAAGGILAYGRSRRTASPGQMRALIARDGGCSFPDCDIPPQWCEAHHVIPWLAGGPTDLSNLALGCKYHHRHFEERNWECVMIDGRPHWIPPAWVDRERKPIRNLRACDRPITLLDRGGPPEPERCGPGQADHTDEPDPADHTEPADEPDLADEPIPRPGSGTSACASTQRSVSITVALPRKSDRVQRALDLVCDVELAHAVNDAMGSWVEHAVAAAQDARAYATDWDPF